MSIWTILIKFHDFVRLAIKMFEFWTMESVEKGKQRRWEMNNARTKTGPLNDNNGMRLI